MKLPQIKLKGDLVIAIIGFKQSGKSSAAEFFTDAFWDSGIREIGTPPEILEKAYAIIIYDKPENRAALRKVRDKHNTIVIRIRRSGEKISKGEKWIENAKPDLVICNDGELRRFEFSIRDAVKNLLPETKQWKQAIESN